MKKYIYGDGKLNECVIEKLKQHHHEIEIVKELGVIESNAFLFYLSDYFDKEKEIEILKHCVENKNVYMRTCLLFDEAYIGPLYEEGNACFSCVLQAMERNKSDLTLQKFLKMNKMDYLTYIEESIYEQDDFIDIVAFAVVNEYENWLKQEPTLLNEFIVIKEAPFQVVKHHIEPEEYCKICYHMKEDNKEDAEVVFRKIVKRHPRDYRKNGMPEINSLKKLLVDKDTGKIKHVFQEFASRYIPFIGAELYCGEKIDLGYGRDFDYETSQKCAILEALERYSGMYNKKTDSRIYGSYEELKEDAVNPETLGLHDKAQYDMDGYLYTKYSKDLKYYWVWAWSLKKNKAVLIPEQMAYYAPEIIREKTNRFVYETSNGCALGSTIEEAFLYGLFETIERDNFLVSWYNRLPLTEIDVENSELQDVINLKIYIESMGYEMHFYDMSMELKVPAVWGLIINRSEDALVKTYSAAGAHFNPESALRGALLEIVTSISIYEKKYVDADLQARREMMYRDDAKVTEFEDHVLLYSHPEAVERIQYLLDSDEKKKTLKEIYPEWYQNNAFQHVTLDEDIDEIVRRIFEFYDDIYVVNSTGDLLKKCGLASCKILIPGMNTMSFGHQYRRINVDRVLNAPVWAGRAKESITLDEINTLPHPFP